MPPSHLTIAWGSLIITMLESSYLIANWPSHCPRTVTTYKQQLHGWKLFTIQTPWSKGLILLPSFVLAWVFGTVKKWMHIGLKVCTVCWCKYWIHDPSLSSAGHTIVYSVILLFIQWLIWNCEDDWLKERCWMNLNAQYSQKWQESRTLISKQKKVADNFIWTFGLFFQVFFRGVSKKTNKDSKLKNNELMPLLLSFLCVGFPTACRVTFYWISSYRGKQ